MAVSEWLIRRVPERETTHLLEELRELQLDGWDVSALLAPDRSMVGLGYLNGRILRASQLALDSELLPTEAAATVDE